MTKPNKWLQHLVLEINQRGVEVTPEEVKEKLKEIKEVQPIMSMPHLLDELTLLLAFEHEADLLQEEEE